MKTTVSETIEGPTRRRDLVSWALSAVTCAVLLVGVLVIRSTRTHSDSAPPEQGVELVDQPSQERPVEAIIALPTTSHDGQHRFAERPETDPPISGLR